VEAGGEGGGIFKGVFPDAEDAPVGLAEVAGSCATRSQ